MRLLADLNAAYEQRIDMRWKQVMKTLERFDYFYLWMDDMEDLPFPRWWLHGPTEEFDLSTWITKNRVVSESGVPGAHDTDIMQRSSDFPTLRENVAAVLQEIKKLSAGMDDQMSHTHDFLAAASEDLARSSREWAAAHSAIRAQAGMSTMNLPLTMQFAEDGGQTGGSGVHMGE